MPTRSRFDVRTVSRWTVCVLIGYLIIRPGGSFHVLVPVLALLGVISVVTLIVDRKVARMPAAVVGLVVLIGVYGALIGIGNAGLLHGMIVWIVAPILFGAWALSGDMLQLKMTLRTIAIMTAVVGGLILLYVGGELEFIPQLVPQFVLDFVGMQYFEADDGSPTVSNYALSTLIAAAPMWITAAIVPAHPILPPKWASITVAIIAAGAGLVGGRDITTLVMVAVPILMWIAWRIIGGRAANTPRSWIVPGLLVIVGLAGVAVLTAIGNLSVVRTFTRVLSYIVPQGEVSVDDNVRLNQAQQLIDGWMQSPFFGNGLGATLDGYDRSSTKPWNFELQYHVLLFQTGIVGVTLALVAAFLVAHLTLRVLRDRRDLAPVLLVAGAAALAMLIANATNPYLQAPGNMWAPYLGLFALQAALQSSRSVRDAVVADVAEEQDRHGHDEQADSQQNPRRAP
jgi:hypothetical protein